MSETPVGTKEERSADAIEQPQSVGDILSNRRMVLGRSLKDLAGATKIQVPTLRALEENRFGELPAEVYTRGFLRSVARELELDENELLDRYRAQTGAAPITVPSQRDATDDFEARTTQLPVVGATVPLAVAKPQTETADPAPRELGHLFGDDPFAKLAYVAVVALIVIGLAASVLVFSGSGQDAESTATYQPIDDDESWRPAPRGPYDWQTIREN